MVSLACNHVLCYMYAITYASDAAHIESHRVAISTSLSITTHLFMSVKSSSLLLCCLSKRMKSPGIRKHSNDDEYAAPPITGVTSSECSQIEPDISPPATPQQYLIDARKIFQKQLHELAKQIDHKLWQFQMVNSNEDSPLPLKTRIIFFRVDLYVFEFETSSFVILDKYSLTSESATKIIARKRKCD